jgi:hypothetical protein
MASFMTSVLIPLRSLATTPARRPTLVCRWVLDPRTGRPVARWVAEPEMTEQELADSCEQIAAFLRSSDQAVA